MTNDQKKLGQKVTKRLGEGPIYCLGIKWISAIALHQQLNLELQSSDSIPIFCHFFIFLFVVMWLSPPCMAVSGQWTPTSTGILILIFFPFKDVLISFLLKVNKGNKSTCKKIFILFEQKYMFFKISFTNLQQRCYIGCYVPLPLSGHSY